MKRLIVLLFMIAMQQSLFAQINESPDCKSYRDYNLRFSHKAQFEKLKTFKKANPTSIGNTVLLSLPDTIIEYSQNDTARSIYKYDVSGNFLSWTGQWYSDHDWVNTDRESFTYDEDGNYITYLYEEWEDDNWVNDYKASYIYDNYGNEIEDSSERWNGDAWEFSYHSQTINQYDDKGNLLSKEEIKIIGDSTAHARRYECTYDSSGNILTVINYHYGSDPWLYQNKYTYTYDSNNNTLTSLNQHYSDNDWTSGNIVTYSYDSNGNCISRGNSTYSYDSNDNLLSIGESQIYTYDANGNISTWDFYTWDVDLNQWIKKWSEPCLIYIKTSYTGDIWNYPVRKFGNGITFLTYGSGYRMIFSWTQMPVSGTKDIQENNRITIYPNPASTALYIKGIENLSKIKVYTMDGKLIPANSITGNNQQINISQYKSGIYILKIETAEGHVVRKFIKK